MIAVGDHDYLPAAHAFLALPVSRSRMPPLSPTSGSTPLVNDTLTQRLTSAADTIKYREPEKIDLHDIRGLLNEAASYIADLSTLLPRSTEFSYHRLGDGMVEVHLKVETEEASLPTILHFLAAHF
jgi:hypothetical protein